MLKQKRPIDAQAVDWWGYAKRRQFDEQGTKVRRIRATRAQETCHVQPSSAWELRVETPSRPLVATTL
eukprot:8158715-Pyramimonas_sp.AAC.1